MHHAQVRKKDDSKRFWWHRFSSLCGDFRTAWKGCATDLKDSKATVANMENIFPALVCPARWGKLMVCTDGSGRGAERGGDGPGTGPGLRQPSCRGSGGDSSSGNPGGGSGFPGYPGSSGAGEYGGHQGRSRPNWGWPSRPWCPRGKRRMPPSWPRPRRSGPT